MNCPRCQHEIPSGAKFCLECGEHLTLTCAKCGTELPAGAKFCLECGQPLGVQAAAASRFASPEAYTPKYLAEKILTSKSALEGERRKKPTRLQAGCLNRPRPKGIAVTQRCHFTFSARVFWTPMFRIWRRPKINIVKQWLWPATWACARSSRIATLVWANCTGG